MSEDQTRAWLKQAHDSAFDLRFKGVSSLRPDISPAEVMEALRDVRGRLDQVEELLYRALQVKGQLGRNASSAESVATDAWDEASVKNSPRTQVVNDYTGPRERYAQNNLRTLNERRDHRIAVEILDLATETVELIKLSQRGLDGLRQECLMALRHTQFESHLER